MYQRGAMLLVWVKPRLPDDIGEILAREERHSAKAWSINYFIQTAEAAETCEPPRCRPVSAEGAFSFESVHYPLHLS